jgi:hypothetical protein
MCEQFKTDFVKKICKIVDGDLAHRLKLHYGIDVIPCSFKGTPGCKELILYKGLATFPTDHPVKYACCLKCECYMCEACMKYKAYDYVTCVNCYIHEVEIGKVVSRKPRDFQCKLCLTEERYCTVPRSFMYSSLYYCQKCNSLNSF